VGFYYLDDKRLDFFKRWSKASAWVYGLILGDGHVSLSNNSGCIQFVGNLDTVERFNRLLFVERKPPYEHGVYHTYFNSLRIAKLFRERGIHAKKKEGIEYPKDLPKEYERDFLRGLLDTDGTVAFNDPKRRGVRGRKKFYIGFASASLSFCTKVKDALGVDRKITTNRKIMNGKEYIHYGFNIGMQESIAICREIYGRSNKDTRNEERYLRYIEGERLLSEYNNGCCICGGKIHTENLCSKHMWEKKRLEKPPQYCFCGKGATLKGMCGAHYHQKRREERAVSQGREYVHRARKSKSISSVTNQKNELV
jgi:hypothetical protein